jgi:hypothetical protein
MRKKKNTYIRYEGVRKIVLIKKKEISKLKHDFQIRIDKN